MKVSLGELASVEGMPSEPTLRRLIDQHADFPVLARGKNGQAYEFDLDETVDFIKALRRREEEQARARSVELQQYGLSLGLTVEASAPGLTISDRKALLEEEVIAIKVARQRGELIWKSSVEAAVGQVLVWHQQQALGFSARLSKRLDLTRQMQSEIDAMVLADLKEFAARLKKIGEIGTIDNGDGGTIASAEMDDPAL